MIKIEIFDRLVLNKFDFLKKEKGFSEVKVVDTQRVHSVRFYKGIQSFRVDYSFSNKTINVSYWPVENSYSLAIPLAGAMHDSNPNFNFEADYSSIMPFNIPLESSVEKLAVLLEKHFSDMLK